jgi:hypothetical protein
MDEVMEAVFGDRTALPGMTQGGNREVPGDPLDGGLHLSQ